MVHRLTYLTVALFLVTGSSNVPAQSTEASAQLVDAIDAGVAVGQSLSPFDVLGTTSIADEFEEDITATEKIRFRIQFDSESELVVWAVERSRDGVQVGGQKRTAVSYSSTIVDGRNAVTWTGSQTPERHAFESFEKAVLESYIPLPRYWALLQFPFFGNAENELRRITAEATVPEAKVSIKEKSDSIEFVVRTDKNEKQFDIRKWEFELPNYLPINSSVQRAADGTAVTYFSQSVEWERKDSKDVPLLVTAESMIVRKKRVGRATHQRGKRFTDTELKWLDVVKDPSEKRQPPTLTSVLTIQRFLDEAVSATR